jgi:hypothetical protein
MDNNIMKIYDTVYSLKSNITENKYILLHNDIYDLIQIINKQQKEINYLKNTKCNCYNLKEL